ncbi:MAG: MmcQ/YjbR family DNA-binding protein [Oscillospiraceae bacterium]|jgi:predicted DNA-binding protein (MmcQ/YjbR family)|nr:MmcQ/YjbR family DNA-binding protein [Oscillospiraceae bacterium]
MTRQAIIDFCMSLPGTYEDYPFDDDGGAEGAWTVMRHRVGRKTFAMIYERQGRLCVNLKCDPIQAELLRQVFADVTPGYHMNKQHWNTITIGGDVSAKALCQQIEASYALTQK